MNYIDDILVDIQKEIAPSDETIEAVRSRRDEVLSIAGGYAGALRTYIAGSIAHRTANDDTDADCGVVLDRRSYHELGPDGDGGAPIVNAVIFSKIPFKAFPVYAISQQVKLMLLIDDLDQWDLIHMQLWILFCFAYHFARF